MKSILTHSIVAILAVMLTSLFMRQCSPVAAVTETITRVDTVYSVYTVEVRDTLYEVRWRTKHDTIEHIVQVPQDTTPVKEGIYSYDEYYQDSSYRVSGNIVYSGLIEEHRQMFTKMKDEVILLPTTRTVFRNRDVIKTTQSTRQPRFLAGAYITADKFKVGQLGIQATLVDNRYRQYTVGKDILDSESWKLGIQVPLFYSKPRLE